MKYGALSASLLFVSVNAFAGSTVLLGIPLQPQLQSEWCWAASTQMVAGYLGSTLSQCEQANTQDNQTTCCPASSDPTSACNQGGSAYDSLAAWGFTSVATPSSIPFAQIQSEIDQKRPIITNWKELDGPGGVETGGAHDVVVEGYSTDNGLPEVYILNPAPHGTGHPHWAPYDTYLVSETSADNVTTYHKIAKTLTNIQWAPTTCNYDFSEVSTSDFAVCEPQYAHHGEYVSALATSNGKMAGAFQSTSNNPLVWGHSLSDMEQSIAKQGMGNRPTFATVNSGASPTYDAVWAAESNEWNYLPGKDEATFQSVDAEQPAGSHVRDLFMYEDNGAVVYWAVWVQDWGASDHWSLAQPFSTFQQTDTHNRGDGYRLVRLSTYADANGALYVTGLWFPSTVSDYYWVAGLSPSDYQAAFNTWVGTNGYTLDYISMYNGTYNAIFIKN